MSSVKVTLEVKSQNQSFSGIHKSLEVQNTGGPTIIKFVAKII